MSTKSTVPFVFTSVATDSQVTKFVVDTVNGRKVSKVADVQEALKFPQDGYHVIEFMRSDALRRMVLDATGMKAATERVLRLYQNPAAENILKPAGSVALAR